MNKTAIRNFAIWARKKLIADVCYRAGLMGVTEKGISNALPQSTNDIEFYDIGMSEPYSISGEAVKQRRALVQLINQKAKDSSYETAFTGVMEEVAYTWFNRLIAIRFMEINDYLPSHIRVLSSDAGKMEPDLVTTPFDADFTFEQGEEEKILQLKQDNELDVVFRILFVKQCNELSKILPRLFETTRDYTELLLNISFVDHDGIVYRLVHDISEEDFDIKHGGQVEIIGWLYQYYNTELKDETFSLLKRNVKVTKERIPSATQLFTPDWIVHYMVENSLGRLWLEGHPYGSLKENWKYYLDETEQEVITKDRLTEIRKEYKTINPEDIKLIDPCMGSGHILVYAFDVLMQIYESAGWSQREAARSIIENNLYGLDIDNRAAQLSYFAVMMKARQYNRRILNSNVKCNIYSIQESNTFDTSCLIKLGDLRHVGKKIVDVFYDAKEFGTAINIKNISEEEISALEKQIHYLESTLDITDLLNAIYIKIISADLIPLVRQAKLLVQKYDIAVTNPPYMGNSNMNSMLSAFVKDNYPNAKADLSTVFMERCLSFCKDNGFVAMINIPVWMSLSSFEIFRNNLFPDNTIINMLHLGRGIFGSDFGTTSFVIRNSRIKNYIGVYHRVFEEQGSVDHVSVKQKWFLEGKGKYCSCQDDYMCLPGKPIAYWASKNFIKAFEKPSMSKYADLRQGLITGDNEYFLRSWFECDTTKVALNGEKTKKWFVHYKGGDYRKWYGNNQLVVNWENEGEEICNFRDEKGKLRSRPQNIKYYLKEGFTWSALTASKFSVRYMPKGGIFAAKGASGYLHDIENLPYFMGFCNSIVCSEILSLLSQSLDYNPGTVSQLPINIDINRKEEVSLQVKKCVDVSREDWDSFETSWDFKKHPLI